MNLGAGSGSGFQLGAVAALRCCWLQRDSWLGGAPPGPGLLSEGKRLRDGCGWDAGTGVRVPARGSGAARADGRVLARRSGRSRWTAPGGGSNRRRRRGPSGTARLLPAAAAPRSAASGGAGEKPKGLWNNQKGPRPSQAAALSSRSRPGCVCECACV